MPLSNRAGLLRWVFFVILTVQAPNPAALAQGSRSIMRGLPDGTHEVLMLTAPNYANLRTPDFTAIDLALMKQELVLSQEQATVISQLIEQYLLSFRALTKELAAAADPKAEYVPEAEQQVNAKPDEDSMQVRLDDLDLPESANVSWGTSVNTSKSDDPNAPAPPPIVKVSVTIDAPEGEEIPQATIDTIRQRAGEAAAKMVEHIMAEAAARQAGEEPKKTVIEAERSFDVIKAEHDALMMKVEEFLKAKANLRDQFVLDAQASLADEQVARWPALERALYRERNVPRGQLPGESVDLVKIVDGLGLADDQIESIASHLEAYEAALDAALRQRDALLATATTKIDEAIANRKPDLALSLTDRVTSLRVAVRSVNRTHTDQIAQALGSEMGETFRRAALKASYSNVYVETRGRKMFAALEKVNDLDAQTRVALTDLETAYEAELASINEQLRSTIDREWPLGPRRGIEHLKSSMEGTPSEAFDREDPVRALIIKRAEMDDRYLKLVSEMVGEARAAPLPKPRKDRQPIRIESD
jgi:hypothetical protein